MVAPLKDKKHAGRCIRLQEGRMALGLEAGAVKQVGAVRWGMSRREVLVLAP